MFSSAVSIGSIEELEDEPDVLAPLRQLRVAEVVIVLSGDDDLALGGLVEAREDVHQGRLAGPTAHHGRELAARDVERDAAERFTQVSPSP